MSYNIEITPLFKKQLKRLNKKFPSLKKDFAQLLDLIENDPKQGTAIGHNCYKIRLAITSKGKGKSGGSRVITHLQISKTAIYLLSIYDKSEQSDVEDSDLLYWIRSLNRP